MTSLVTVTEENFHLYRDEILAIERVSFPTPWSLHAFAEELRRPVANLWVLVRGGAVAGYVCFWRFDRELHLMNIAVHPGLRGKGLGRHLLDRLMAAARDGGVETVWLEVRPSNTVALAMYRTAGFAEIGRRKAYYRDTREDAIVMARFLEAAERRPCRRQDAAATPTPVPKPLEGIE
ncbi:MAG: ribosomal protein S18-alanine N-acetyltransferase [Deltaproteobacteria bacterium]|nr:ribosomal protein S18-alanine N-acetyltransferase [Deltaproteobacteria bacterium]MBW1924645.1 ribosomal protein S18-alanine N-acetyltransferase [Deltaproteobacteria bacterium]MBW1950523.1 ribosomal protein S18-alanine N-acetyltransferase [Deltaproteobacteria bacterium]MBW2008522.1 ribosomal protein S18-alanine N-acetyltransferase [Deltaproteobacteria bacterium]MBW2103047.1 ribosomal protein S18-alanine N-acetyltransferase [Deltaproteobacteria bacterium]